MLTPARRPIHSRGPAALGVLLLGSVVLLLGTGSSCDDHVIGSGIPITSSCLRSPPLTYDNFGDGMIGRQCRPCHSALVREAQRGNAPLGIDFDNEQDVLDWADRIQERTVDLKTMPPAGGMLEEERKLFGEWLRCDVFPRLGQVELQDTGEAP